MLHIAMPCMSKPTLPLTDLVSHESLPAFRGGAIHAEQTVVQLQGDCQQEELGPRRNVTCSLHLAKRRLLRGLELDLEFLEVQVFLVELQFFVVDCRLELEQFLLELGHLTRGS